MPGNGRNVQRWRSMQASVPLPPSDERPRAVIESRLVTALDGRAVAVEVVSDRSLGVVVRITLPGADAVLGAVAVSQLMTHLVGARKRIASSTSHRPPKRKDQ